MNPTPPASLAKLTEARCRAVAAVRGLGYDCHPEHWSPCLGPWRGGLELWASRPRRALVAHLQLDGATRVLWFQDADRDAGVDFDLAIVWQKRRWPFTVTKRCPANSRGELDAALKATEGWKWTP